MIYESYDSNDYWDGTYNNQPCPAGTYNYKIQFGNKTDDGKKIVIGHVILLR